MTIESPGVAFSMSCSNSIESIVSSDAIQTERKEDQSIGSVYHAEKEKKKNTSYKALMVGITNNTVLNSFFLGGLWDSMYA